MTKMLRINSVEKRTGLSRSTIYRYIKRDMFPKPIRLGLNSCGWPEDMIVAWLNSRIQAASG